MKTGQALNKFNELKTQLRGMAHAGVNSRYGVDSQARHHLERLKELRASVQAMNAKLVEAREELSRQCPWLAQEAEANAAILADAEAFSAEVDSIKV
mgnify:CR=1 FL=1